MSILWIKTFQQPSMAMIAKLIMIIIIVVVVAAVVVVVVVVVVAAVVVEVVVVVLVVVVALMKQRTGFNQIRCLLYYTRTLLCKVVIVSIIQ